MMSHNEFQTLLQNRGISYESCVSFGDMLGITVRGTAESAQKTTSEILCLAPCTRTETQNGLTTIWAFPHQGYASN